VRYADDWVVLARSVGSRLTNGIEDKREAGRGREIKRDKTRGINLKEAGASLDFLGYTFRWDRHPWGRGGRSGHVFPSKKSVQRERDKGRERTGAGRCSQPVPRLMTQLNRQKEGLGELVLLRVATNGVAEDQQLPAGAVGATTSPSPSSGPFDRRPRGPPMPISGGWG
jgi:hypothetical protein